MASETRQDQLIYSDQGKYFGMEKPMQKTVAEVVGTGDSDIIMDKVMKMAEQHGSSGGTMLGSSN